MIPSLAGPRLKLNRAKEHVDTLDQELRVFIESYSNRRPVEHTFDGTWHIICTDPPIHEPLPPRISLICGDIIHNIRCALDHLVWQLVLIDGNEPDRWNSFPIYAKAEDFESRVKFPKDPKRSPLHGIDLNGEAWALIEREQPYNRWKLGKDPAGHVLSGLAFMSNVDKHRTLMAQMLMPQEDTIWDAVAWNPDARLLEYRCISRSPISQEGKTEIIRLRFADAGPDPQVRVKNGLIANPTIGDGKTQAHIGHMWTIRNYVAHLVDRFEPFFP